MKVLFALLWTLNFSTPSSTIVDLNSTTPFAAVQNTIVPAEDKPVRGVGTVLFFKERNGIGLIQQSSGKEIPFYANDTQKEYGFGTKVTFDWKKDQKRGERATNIEEIKD